MRTNITKLVAPFCACIVTSCDDRDSSEAVYRSIAQKPLAEIVEAMCNLNPENRVQMYLYAIEQRRPSDYGLTPFGCIDEETVDIAVRLAAKSDSGLRTFALIRLLHEAPRATLTVRKDIFLAGQACSKFFGGRSPCHDLAKDIDAVYGKPASAAHRGVKRHGTARGASDKLPPNNSFKPMPLRGSA